MRGWMVLLICALYGMVTCGNIYAAENDPLPVDIKSFDGQSVMVMDGEVLYTAVPVTFTPVSTSGADQYSISIDDGRTFGAFVNTEEGVTLYPDDDTAPEGRWQIKFKNTTDDSETLSSVYKVCFDTTAPTIVPDEPDTYDSQHGGNSRLSFHLADDASGICRAVSKRGEEVIAQFRANPGESVNEYDLAVDTDGSPEGENTIVTQCFDNAGNSCSVTYSYLTDTVAPKLNVSGISQGAFVSGECFLNISATDEGSDAYIDYVITRSDREEVVTTTYTNIRNEADIRFEHDGRYTVEISASDSAGNRTGTVRRDFTLDGTAPVVSIEGVSDNVDIRGGAAVTIDVCENVEEHSKVNIILQRTLLGKTEKILNDTYDIMAEHDMRTVDISSDGEYEISVAATDGAGNGSSASKRFRIDTTAPEVSISGAADGQTVSAIPTLRFGAGELFYDSAIMTYILEKKEGVGYVKAGEHSIVMRSARDHVDIKPPGEGRYRLLCTASDRSGNTASSSCEFTIDYTPPVISGLDSIDNRFFKSFALPRKILSYVKDATDVRADAYIDDRKTRDGDVILEEGKYVLTILAEDAAGNAAEDHATFIVDHTAPQIVLSGFDRDGNIRKGSLVKVSLLEEGDILESVSFNGRDIAIAGNTACIAVDSYGQYTIGVVAKDPAGNITDTNIHTSCYMHPPALSGYIKTEKTMSADIYQKDKNIDFRGLAIGLFSVLTGTFGLAYRTYLRD